MSETLTEVDEKTRADDQLFLRATNWEGHNFHLEAWDETISFFFDDVDAFIEAGGEWAVFYSDGDEVFSIETEEDGFIDWPHWLFEELLCISNAGMFRPEDDYETTFTPTRNAA